jgi:hypothetical protein
MGPQNSSPSEFGKDYRINRLEERCVERLSRHDFSGTIRGNPMLADWAAVHETAEKSKLIIRAFYGESPSNPVLIVVPTVAAKD